MHRTEPKFNWLDAVIMAMVVVEIVLLGHWLSVGYGYRWRWELVPNYILRVGPAGVSAGPLLVGLGQTLIISVGATLLAVALGLPMALMRLASGAFWKLISGTYVHIVRNLPPLILIFIMTYYVLVGLDNVVVGIIALGLYQGAYITEIIRSGVEGIPAGQFEAAHALGLTRYQELRHVVLPQALRDVLPALTGQFISAIKASAIVSLISVQELTFAGNQIASSARIGMEMWITVAIMYLVLTLSCSLAFNALESRLSRQRA